MTDFDFDFGFTAVTEEELEVVQQTKAAAETASGDAQALQNKIDTLYNMFQPLLNNLRLNPEKDYIYWPNRMDKIELFSDKLDQVYKS
jgi:pyrroloquinoline quinone (PQQ) biosynthesis protein C